MVSAKTADDSAPYAPLPTLGATAHRPGDPLTMEPVVVVLVALAATALIIVGLSINDRRQ